MTEPADDQKENTMSVSQGGNARRSMSPPKLALVILAVSAVTIAWAIYWGVRDNMPTWSTVGIVAMVGFFALVTWNAMQPSAEERIASELSASSTARRITGRVLA